MSWFKRKPKLPEPHQWEEIIQAYGAVLAKEKPFGVGGSYAESDLPFDKLAIKASLLGTLSQPDLSEEQMGALFIGFTELGRFQPNGGTFSPMWSNRPDEIPRSERERKKFISDERNLAKTVNAEVDALQKEWEEVRGLWAQLHGLGLREGKNNA